MSQVKSFRKIENTILLNEKAMNELREIAKENQKVTYSDLIIFLIRMHREMKKAHQWSHDYPTSVIDNINKVQQQTSWTDVGF